MFFVRLKSSFLMTDNPRHTLALTREDALQLFELPLPYTKDQLDLRRDALLTTWHPHRYAGRSNNPKKYMQMYTQGEEMSRRVLAAYRILAAPIDVSDLGDNPATATTRSD
jgi:hypothetical protein